MDIIQEAKEALAQHEPMDAYSYDLISRLVDMLECRPYPKTKPDSSPFIAIKNSEIFKAWDGKIIDYYGDGDSWYGYVTKNPNKDSSSPTIKAEFDYWLPLPPVGEGKGGGV